MRGRIRKAFHWLTFVSQKFRCLPECVFFCVCLCTPMCVCVCRQAGWQATVTTWQQPTTLHFWPRQALQLQNPALPKAPSFPLNRWDDWAASSDTHTHSPPSPSSLLVVHLPPCSPGQLNSYQRSWALFFQKANPTPVSGLYTGNRGLCAVWVWVQWVQCVYGRER